MKFEDQAVATIQGRLANLGYYKLRIDGKAGVGTENAMVRFKEVHGLRARAYPGPLTLSTLFSADAKPAPKIAPVHDNEPPWLTEARSLLGTREARGRKNNPVIMQWAEDLNQWYTGDDVPWCGLFTAHCMYAGAPNEPQDFNRLGAREWLKYGVAASEDDLPLGGVAVFWRTSRTHWHGHVAPAITGQNKTHLRVIGGNQEDNVTERWFSREQLLGVRVPEAWAGKLPEAPYAATGVISKSEA